MGRINFGRVVMGGLFAGILINVSEFVLNSVVLKADMEAGLKALGKTVPQSGGTIAVWTILGFAVGIVAVWLYAAIRPRYGPGVGTAVRAGVCVWFLENVVCTVVFVNLGIFPFNALPVVWTLAEGILATVLGAWVYREGVSATV